MSVIERETEVPRIFPSEVEEAVQRGAALLDEKRPGWADEIDTDKLRLVSCTDCVLGQLYYGNYFFGLEKLGIRGCEYGFNTPSEAIPIEDYIAPWLAAIMERRSA